MSVLGKKVFQTADKFGTVGVYDDGDKRYLSFGQDLEQSCLLKSDPFLLQHQYARAMLLVLLFKQPKRGILFGLGGGCLASCLHHHFPEMTLQAVELRRTVIKVAYRYFQLPRSERLDVINMDVGEYIEEHDSAKADLIFSDIYDVEGLDLTQLQPWFIEQCDRLLSEDGWLVLNCWREHRNEKETLEAISTRFADVRVCATIDGNWIIFAGKKVDHSSNNQLRDSAKSLSRQLGYSLTRHLNRLNRHTQ